MHRIEIESVSPGSWQVTVHARGGDTTRHVVRASAADLERYGGTGDPEALIEASLRFLLAREPASSILSSFELPVIERYFPDYPREMAARGV